MKKKIIVNFSIILVIVSVILYYINSSNIKNVYSSNGIINNFYIGSIIKYTIKDINKSKNLYLCNYRALINSLFFYIIFYFIKISNFKIILI